MAAHPRQAAPLSEMAAPSIQHATRTSDPKEALLAALQPFIESVGEALVGETVERLLRQTCALSLQLAAREQLRAEQTHLLPRILDELVAEEVRAMAPAIAREFVREETARYMFERRVETVYGGAYLEVAPDLIAGAAAAALAEAREAALLGAVVEAAVAAECRAAAAAELAAAAAVPPAIEPAAAAPAASEAESGAASAQVRRTRCAAPTAGQLAPTRLEVVQEGDDVVVRLHAAEIVRLRSHGELTLSSGGWRTVSTLEAINGSVAELVPVRPQPHARTPHGAPAHRCAPLWRSTPPPAHAHDNRPRP